MLEGKSNIGDFQVQVSEQRRIHKMFVCNSNQNKLSYVCVTPVHVFERFVLLLTDT